MDLKVADEVVTAMQLGADERLWQDFLSRSANGTIFHDLDFLRYHPRGRFRFHHIIFTRRGKPVALMPGGIEGSDERLIFCSPLGASIGGPAVTADLNAKLAESIVEALQNYARQQGWAGIRITLPPHYYSFETADLITFALFCKGFKLEHRWLCPALQLDLEPNAYERLYKTRQISPVRAARRNGMRSVESGVEGLQDFLWTFRDTYSRHGTVATHTEEEIRDLLIRFPDRIRIHLAMLDDVPVAALLIFQLTKTIATTFYICRSSQHLSEHGPAFLIADAMDRLSAAGFRYLDLGPSASDQKFNQGNTFFKEGLGAVGHCRDLWNWSVPS
jgi:Acetyltransferase (GNAT) domain